MNWYLYNKPNAYMLAGEHLKRQGFEVFHPNQKHQKEAVNLSRTQFLFFQTIYS